MTLPNSLICLSFIALCMTSSAIAQDLPEKTSAAGAKSAELETIEIVGQRTDYTVKEASSATRFKVDLKDLPLSIQVVPRAVFDDQGAVNLGEALRNVSGITPGDTSGNRVEKFYVRGFENDRRIAVDGFLPPTAFGNLGYLDLANVEQIEVLKGPASVLYGQANPGGFVNLVTKRPNEVSAYNAKFSGGSYGFFRAEVDINKPLTSDGKFLSRVNFAYQEADSFRNLFINTKRLLIAPSFAWKINQRSSLDLQIEYAERSAPSDFGLLPINGRADALPRDFYEGEAFSKVGSKLLQARLTYEYKFENGWAFKSAVRGNHSESTRNSADARGIGGDGRTVSRRARLFPQDVEDISLQNTIVGSFATGSISHDFLVGIDLSKSNYDASDRRASLAPIDVFDPVYGAIPGVFDNPRFTTRSVDSAAVYFQNLSAIGENWKVLIGGRYDYADQFETRNSNVTNSVTDKEFSPRAGIVYQPSPNVSLYGGYSESFFPPPALLNADSLAGDAAFQPEKGMQYEVGIKTNMYNERLTTTLAVFDLTRENVLTADPLDTDLSVQTGEQRSRGIELDARGSVFSNLDIIATLTVLDTEVTEDNRFEIGNRLPNTSRLSGSLWAKYQVEQGRFPNMKLGIGVFAQSERQGNLSNSYTAPGFYRVDAFVSYPFNDHVDFSLNIKNLFDRDYIASALGNTINPAEPLSVLARIQLRY